MKHEDSTLYPEQVSEFEVPAEADGPIKIVKNHLKPRETDPNAAKSAATGVCVCVNVCVCVCVCIKSTYLLSYTLDHHGHHFLQILPLSRRKHHRQNRYDIHPIRPEELGALLQDYPQGRGFRQ